MRLCLFVCACGLAVGVQVPARAQHALPSRAFEPSLPAVAASPVPSVAEWWRNGGPRIRPIDPRVSGYLRSGLERSSRMRALIATVEASSVVTYIGLDPRMRADLAGRVIFVGAGGGFRYLRAMINPDLSSEQIIASIAHELQHVVEMIERPEVVSEGTMVELYQEIGRPNHSTGLLGWETERAQDAGEEVRRQLGAGVPTTLARRELRR